LNCPCLFAGNQDDPIGGRSAGLSHASVTLRDGWSCNNNQAGLGFLTDPVAGIYFENRFGVKEFATKAGFIAYPFKPGTLAINYRRFGYSKYYESKAGLAFGRKLFKRFAVGVQVDYLQTYIADNYGNNNYLAAEIGILSEPVNNFFIGFHLFNPGNAARENLLEPQLPASARLGFSYLLEDRVLLATEVVKNNNSSPMFRFGIELQAIDKLYARLGFITLVNNYSLGLGYSLKHVTADFSFTSNRLLGYTPQISVMFNL
jgi:hypothetical protein